MRVPVVKVRNVLVTGCSSGIGAATARCLQEQGWNVLPTARKPEDLERLRSQGFTPIHLDVANSASVEKAAAEVLKAFGGQVGGIVNNAGFGQPGAIEDLTREALRYQFEVNLFGLQELTNKFIPILREQGWGRIVNISSMVGRVAVPFFGAYSASKFALEAVSDAMRVELWKTGVAVCLIEPGPISTEFGNTARQHGHEKVDIDNSTFKGKYETRLSPDRMPDKDSFKLPPEAVARKIIHALESPRPKARYPITITAHISACMRRFAPASLIDYLMWRHWQQKSAPKTDG